MNTLDINRRAHSGNNNALTTNKQSSTVNTNQTRENKLVSNTTSAAQSKWYNDYQPENWNLEPSTNTPQFRNNSLEEGNSYKHNLKLVMDIHSKLSEFPINQVPVSEYRSALTSLGYNREKSKGTSHQKERHPELGTISYSINSLLDNGKLTPSYSIKQLLKRLNKYMDTSKNPTNNTINKNTQKNIKENAEKPLTKNAKKKAAGKTTKASHTEGKEITNNTDNANIQNLDAENTTKTPAQDAKNAATQANLGIDTEGKEITNNTDSANIQKRDTENTETTPTQNAKNAATQANLGIDTASTKVTVDGGIEHNATKWQLATTYLNDCSEEEGSSPQKLQQAVILFEELATAGDVDAMYILYDIFRTGLQNINKDDRMAFKWLSKIANTSDDHSIYNEVGKFYEMGKGVKKNVNQAFKFYQLAASKNDPEGLYNLAHCYETGTGINKNLKLAIEYYKKAGLQNNLTAQERFCYYYFSAGGGIDFSDKQNVANKNIAIQWLEAYVKTEEAPNKANYSQYLYILGTSLLQNKNSLNKVLIYLNLAIERKNIQALCLLAKIYANGIHDMQPNIEKSSELYNQAIKNGHLTAKYEYALLNLDNPGKRDEIMRLLSEETTDNNSSRAKLKFLHHFLRQENYKILNNAEKKHIFQSFNTLKNILPDNAQAIWGLACCYKDGIGTDSDHNKAIELFTHAIDDLEHSNPDDFYMLAMLIQERNLSRSSNLLSTKNLSQIHKDSYQQKHKDHHKKLMTIQTDVDNYLRRAAHEYHHPQSLYMLGQHYLTIGYELIPSSKTDRTEYLASVILSNHGSSYNPQDLRPHETSKHFNRINTQFNKEIQLRYKEVLDTGISYTLEAAELGHYKAMLMIAEIYYVGIYGHGDKTNQTIVIKPKNEDLAYYWFNKVPPIEDPQHQLYETYKKIQNRLYPPAQNMQRV